MSPVHLRNLGIPRNQLEGREGFSRTRRPVGGPLGHSADWKDMDQVLQVYQLLKDLFQCRMDSKRFNLSSHWAELGASFQNICIKDIYYKDLMVITKGWNPTKQRTADPDRAYSDSFKLARSSPNQLSSSFTPFRHQQISCQELPFFTIPGSFREKTRIQGQKQDLFQEKAERVRPKKTESVGLGERSTQEQEIVVNTSRISSATNRNITPSWTEHNVVTPESNLNSDKPWLQMSLFSVKTQESLDDFQKLNETFQRNVILQEAIIKAIQESCSQLSKAS
ncbi:hypothetical protein O181_047697 [Austropuccinia psidii MF-1]|uniref:Uncharacterized protein n=1 Tax=Austropuccinia psidii MF-1 TaxID=1389203 RepID=A0A9Q3DTN4_9BASI|nr:hypothetical protein [Austropuccinia psidii MF-1]